MLDASDELLATFRQSYVTRMHVNSWRGEELLFDDIPAASGNLSIDRSLSVPERVTLEIPRTVDNYLWVPNANDHPVAPYGQRLQISLGVDVGGTEEILRLGWFLVSDTSVDGDSVSVTANGLLQQIDEAKFVAPFEPTGTLITTIAALVEPALTITYGAEVSALDRSVPLGMKWDEDRLAALNEMLDALPADAYVTEDGYLQIIPEPDPMNEDIVWDLTDDPANGTIIEWAGQTTRDGAYNIVVVRGEAPQTNETVQAVFTDDLASSSTRYGGPFSPLPVPFFFSTPALGTVAQCEKAARNIMARKRRARSRLVSVSTVPNAALRTGDVVTVTAEGLDAARGTIESFSLPLNAGGGAMTMTVSLVDE